MSILAAVSHLPHVLAFAFMAESSRSPRCRGAASTIAGTGFRDFTRLAASHPAMWRDVCLANRAALRRELAIYRDELERIEALSRTATATHCWPCSSAHVRHARTGALDHQPTRWTRAC